MSDILKWLINLLAGSVVLYILSNSLQIPTALKIIKKLMKDNHPNRNQGLGLYHADRFLDVWYCTKYRSIPNSSGQRYKGYGLYESRHTLRLIDGMLKEEGLIIVQGENLPPLPIRNWRNYLVVKLIERQCIKKYGDDKKHYKNFKAELKKECKSIWCRLP